MSLHFADVLSSYWNVIPFAVLGASLAGSLHCVSMCGGLVTAVCRTRSEIIQYQLGRLLGYASLGAIAGFFGQALLESQWMSWLQWVSALLLSGALIAAGLSCWRHRSFHFFRLPAPLMQKVFNRSRGSALGMGLASVLLPCGWLHGFVLGAVATRSIALGAAFLFLFWLGTLPALMMTPAISSRILKPVSARAPRISAVILICAGLFSIGWKISGSMPQVTDLSGDPRAPAAEESHCHHHD